MFGIDKSTLKSDKPCTGNLKPASLRELKDVYIHVSILAKLYIHL